MIVVFGGTFDPVTLGHMHVAQQIRSALNPQTILFLPCFVPVHRAQPMANAQQRCEMIELALDESPGMALSRLEIDRGGESFMIDSLESLSKIYPGHALVLAMGADAYNNFANWKEPGKILRIANLIVCHRPGYAISNDRELSFNLGLIENNHQGMVVDLQIEPNNCSSTEVRRQLAVGENVDNCIHPAVRQYIISHQIYRT